MPLAASVSPVTCLAITTVGSGGKGVGVSGVPSILTSVPEGSTPFSDKSFTVPFVGVVAVPKTEFTCLGSVMPLASISASNVTVMTSPG